MVKREDLTKEERINVEEKRLRRIYKDLPKDTRAIIDGLIRRAAWSRITLEDYEKDIDENGYMEMFSQSDKTDPYERERPVARLYNSMTKNYQSAIKQLDDKLPKAEPKSVDDGFDDFVRKRDGLM